MGRGSSTSGTGSNAGTLLRATDNYRLGTSKDALRGREGEGLAVDPSNASHVVEVDIDMLAGECLTHVSSDGGATWSPDARLRAPEGYLQPGSSPCSVTEGSPMDQSVAFGSGRNVYTTLAVASTSAAKSHAALVARSADGGSTFTTAVVAMHEGTTPKTAAGNPGPDYAAPKLAVQPGGGSNGADRIVLVAENDGCQAAVCAGNAVAAVSDDGGATWSTPVQINKPYDPSANPFGVQELAQVVIDRNGTWYTAWRTNGVAFASQNPSLADGFLVVAQSSDQGRTWTTSNAEKVRGYVYTGPAKPPYAKTPTAFGCCSFPRLAADPSSGTLYMVWNQGPGLYGSSSEGPSDVQAADHFINPASEVWFASSTDGGTWTAPHQVNDAPVAGNPTQTRHPNLSVAPDGRVDVVWQDRRNWYRACTATHVACTEARLGDTYYASTSDGGRTFTPNRRISDRSQNNDVGFDYRYGAYWDFGPVSAPVGGQVLVAWMDSREGDHTNDNMDIYLARTPVTQSGSVPVEALRAGSSDDLSVSLSRLADPGGSEAVLASTFATRPWTRVVVANDKDAAGILAGGVLARASLGPLLVSPSAGLPSGVRSEVTRMQPVGAYVIGDTSQLSSQVESDLASAGVPADQVKRITGADAASIAAQIATAMDARTDTDRAASLPAFDAVVVAKAGTPEAGSASTLAVSRRLPVLYTDTGSLPAATSAELASLNVTKALVVGGTGVIADSVLQQLTGAGVTPTRLGGADAIATSEAVAREALARGLPPNQVFVADASNPLLGALLGDATGRVGGILLLTHGASAADAAPMLSRLGIDTQVARIVTATADSG